MSINNQLGLKFMAMQTRAEFQDLLVHLICSGAFTKKEMQAAFRESFEIAEQKT